MNFNPAILEDSTLNASIRKEAAKYQALREGLIDVAQSNDPRDVAAWTKANFELTQLSLGIRSQKALTPGTVHVDSALANVSVQYKNAEYIGLSLMPVMPVDKLSGVYFTYDKRSRHAAPDDAIRMGGSANDIDDSRGKSTYALDNFGLRNKLELQLLEAEDAPLNEMLDLGEATNELMDLREEMRIAAILCDPTKFAAGNTAAAASKWSLANGGSIVTDIQAACAGLFSGASPSKKLGYCSLDVWNAMANNAVFKDMFKFTNAQGLASTKMVAGFFGLSDILVGEARKDTANLGQAAAYSRIWTPTVFGVVRVADRPGIRSATFGATLRFKGRKFTDQWFDPSIGTQGAYWNRVSLSEQHNIMANDTGFLLTGVI